jgi:hypothetical protein
LSLITQIKALAGLNGSKIEVEISMEADNGKI